MRRVETFASIKTRYFGPTDHKGSRILATDEGAFGNKRRRLVIGYDHGLDVAENHAAAAQQWLEKFISPSGWATVSMPGLAFNGDYFWTWEHGPEGGAE